MSSVNVPTGPGNRRLRRSRLAAAILALIAIFAGGYAWLRGRSAETVSPDPPKDLAARFGSVQGNVKTRAVGGLDWRSAEVNVALRKSDLVRTYPSSSAEIRFFDDTLVTVRPDSLITIEETSRGPNSTVGKVAWKVTSGEVNYETARTWSGSTEAVTPTLRMALEGNSVGTMRVGEGGITAVAQLSGSANLETKNGEKVHLAANEGLRVEASGKAGAKQILPSAPSASLPEGASVFTLADGAPVQLSWSATTGADSYRVQVHSEQGETIFDLEGVRGVTASVPGLATGAFTYQVAGLTQDGLQGRFSTPVPFRVERTQSPPTVLPASPLLLVIETFEARSNVLRLAGKTEPGAQLTVNGDPVPVQPDGSFSEFVTLARKTGERRVVIRSTSNGRVAEETRTVPPGQ